VIWPAAVEKPPSAYIVQSYQIDPSVEVYLAPTEVDRVCQRLGVTARPPQYIVACYVPLNDRVYLPNTWRGDALQALRIHEHSHRVNGWRHNYERTW
jgi:hypothetical protein